MCTFTQTAGQPTTVTVAAGTSNSASHVCGIQVTFPVFGNAALTLDTTVNAVLMKSVVLSAQTYDSTSAPASTTSTEPGPLQPINCNTTDYEQVDCLTLLSALCAGSHQQAAAWTLACNTAFRLAVSVQQFCSYQGSDLVVKVQLMLTVNSQPLQVLQHANMSIAHAWGASIACMHFCLCKLL